MNAINVIRPYKWYNIWVFDDPRVDLDKEPFVESVGKMIDFFLLKKGIKNGENGFLLWFSDHPFQGVDVEVEWVRSEGSGDIYKVQGEGFPAMEGWLCPALLRYYPEPPPKIFLRLEESKIGRDPDMEKKCLEAIEREEYITLSERIQELKREGP